MPKKQAVERNVALCYVRLSFTRDENDSNSVERQKANIQAVCDEKGWIPEWYEDTQGHKSGRNELNRPQWLSLKTRLKDPDVIALVANDLSRLHRRNWRIGSLIDELNSLGISLKLAAPNRQEFDTSTPQGRMYVQMVAMFDEAYAEDISQRARDSVGYRKSKGISIGMPPFGTWRDENKFLKPSPEGGWYLPDGTFATGSIEPVPGAIWRSYFDCARYILELYANGNMGFDKIAYKLNEEGWPFRTRDGFPRPINNDDIRRVVANWVEYGGVVLERKAKNRPGYEIADEIILDHSRAVFPLELLLRVGEVRKQRTKKPIDHGVKRKVYAYPLSAITYCAHCDALAIKHDNPKLRSVLSGTNMNGTRRYRHASGVSCGCSARSITCDILEQEFVKFVGQFSIAPQSVDLMKELSIQAMKMGDGVSAEDIERQKQEAIALCHRKIKAAINLYGDGQIDREDYLRRVQESEREISHWEARTSDVEQASIEFAACIEAINSLARFWHGASPIDKQGMARNLFEEIVFNLDTRQIVNFRLKAWADRFIVVRTAVLGLENENASSVKGLKRDTLHTGFEPVFPP